MLSAVPGCVFCVAPICLPGSSRRKMLVSLTTLLNALSRDVRNLGSSRKASATSWLKRLNRANNFSTYFSESWVMMSADST